MKRHAAPSRTFARRLFRTGLALVVLAGPAAAHGGHRHARAYQSYAYGGDDPYGAAFVTSDPSKLGGFFDPSYVEGAPTGGVVFSGVSSGDAAAIATALGFDAHEIYGGYVCADPGDSSGACDDLFLSQAINGADPNAGAEPDFFVHGPEGSQFNGLVLGSTYGRAQFQRQSALTSIHAKSAHRLATGAGATVAVLDTGVDATHPWLNGRVSRGWDFVDGHEGAAEGTPDGIDQDGDGTPDDGFGHGTTVAGLVIAAAPDASILPVRVLDVESVGTAGRVAAGIAYALDQGADVINLSLGGEGRSSAVSAVIAEALSRGVIVVAAAGNSTAPTGGAQFPASEPGVVAVTGRGGLPGDVSAPDSNVAGPYPGDRWYRGTGTSFATALVSGGAALGVGARPGFDAAELLASLGGSKRGPARLDLLRLSR